jgi:hypothetical protein
MPNYIRSTASRNREIKHTATTATTTSSATAACNTGGAR